MKNIKNIFTDLYISTKKIVSIMLFIACSLSLSHNHTYAVTNTCLQDCLNTVFKDVETYNNTLTKEDRHTKVPEALINKTCYFDTCFRELIATNPKDLVTTYESIVAEITNDKVTNNASNDRDKTLPISEIAAKIYKYDSANTTALLPVFPDVDDTFMKDAYNSLYSLLTSNEQPSISTIVLATIHDKYLEAKKAVTPQAPPASSAGTAVQKCLGNNRSIQCFINNPEEPLIIISTSLPGSAPNYVPMTLSKIVEQAGTTKTLNLSGMQLASLDGLQNVTINNSPAWKQSITTIRLDPNQLTTIPDNIFNGFTALTALHLNSNQLQNVTEDAFDGLEQLKTLNISDNNKLSDDSKKNICTFVNSIDLDNPILGFECPPIPCPAQPSTNPSCTEAQNNQVGSICYFIKNQTDEFKAQLNQFAKSKELHFDYMGINSLNGLQDIKIDGSSDWKKNIKKLSISNASYEGRRPFVPTNKTLTKIPTNIFCGLENLELLDLSGNNLTTIIAHRFNGLKNLKQLGLHFNALTTVKANAFYGLENVQEIALNLQMQRNADGSPLFKNGITPPALTNGMWPTEFQFKLDYLQPSPLTTIEAGAFNGTTNKLITLATRFSTYNANLTEPSKSTICNLPSINLDPKFLGFTCNTTTPEQADLLTKAQQGTLTPDNINSYGYNNRINAIDGNNKTVLMYAVQQGRDDLVTALLNKKDSYGNQLVDTNFVTPDNHIACDFVQEVTDINKKINIMAALGCPEPCPAEPVKGSICDLITHPTEAFTAALNEANENPSMLTLSNLGITSLQGLLNIKVNGNYAWHKKLTILDLRENQFESIEDNAFKPFSNVVSLWLSYIPTLKTIKKDAFSGLSKLNALSFQRSTGLQPWDSTNKTGVNPNAFNVMCDQDYCLKNLRSLSFLGRSEFTRNLPANIFAGLTTNLSIIHISESEIPSDVFGDNSEGVIERIGKNKLPERLPRESTSNYFYEQVKNGVLTKKNINDYVEFHPDQPILLDLPIQYGPDQGKTALIIAVQEGRLDTIVLLLTTPYKPKYSSSEAYQGPEEGVKVNKAYKTEIPDPNNPNEKIVKTALDFALESTSPNKVKILATLVTGNKDADIRTAINSLAEYPTDKAHKASALITFFTDPTIAEYFTVNPFNQQNQDTISTYKDLETLVAKNFTTDTSPYLADTAPAKNKTNIFFYYKNGKNIFNTASVSNVDRAKLASSETRIWAMYDLHPGKLDPNRNGPSQKELKEHPVFGPNNPPEIEISNGTTEIYTKVIDGTTRKIVNECTANTGKDCCLIRQYQLNNWSPGQTTLALYMGPNSQNIQQYNNYKNSNFNVYGGYADATYLSYGDTTELKDTGGNLITPYITPNPYFYYIPGTNPTTIQVIESYRRGSCADINNTNITENKIIEGN